MELAVEFQIMKLLMRQTWFKQPYRHTCTQNLHTLLWENRRATHTSCKSAGTKDLPGSGYRRAKRSGNSWSRTTLGVCGDAWKPGPHPGETGLLELKFLLHRLRLGNRIETGRTALKTFFVKKKTQNGDMNIELHDGSLEWMSGVPECQREMSQCSSGRYDFA